MPSEYLLPSRIALCVITVTCVGLFVHFYVRAYREETHAQETARYLIAHTCSNAEHTIRSNLVSQCHEARHRIQDAVWHAALINLIVPEGSKAWAFIDAIVLGIMVLFTAVVICLLRNLERDPHFTQPFLPERANSSRKRR
jgi:hypothetical protein